MFYKFGCTRTHTLSCIDSTPSMLGTSSPAARSLAIGLCPITRSNRSFRYITKQTPDWVYPHAYLILH